MAKSPLVRSQITTFPILISQLELKGAVMTTDALNTQNNSALAVINVGADYILPVKENHPGLLADIQLLFSEAIVCNAQSSNNTNKKLVNS